MDLTEAEDIKKNLDIKISRIHRKTIQKYLNDPITMMV